MIVKQTEISTDPLVFFSMIDLQNYEYNFALCSSVRLFLQLFVGGRMSYLRDLYLFPQFILDTNVEECVPSLYSTQMLKNVSPVYTWHKCWRLGPQFILHTNVKECVPSLYSTQMLKNVSRIYSRHKCWRLCPQFILHTNLEDCGPRLYSTQMLKNVSQFIVDTNVEDCVLILYSKQMLTNVSPGYTRPKCWRMCPQLIVDTNVEECVPSL